MGEINEPLPVKLLISMFTGDPDLLYVVRQELVQAFGPTDYQSVRLAFNRTEYYTSEFGPGLEREIIAFQDLIDPGRIAEIKCFTNALETKYASEDGRRRINLDPGYLEQGKLVLATTKNYAHRIYLEQGIYAEVTLVYRNHAFQSLPWTYPDYGSDTYGEILGSIREVYRQQLRQASRLTQR